MAIKYTIPLLIPSAVDEFSSLSKTARHIAHCASDNWGNSKKTIENKIIMLRFILIFFSTLPEMTLIYIIR